MGFVTQAGKILKFNNSQLRKKTFFKELGKSGYTRSNSKLDLKTFQRKSRIIYQRKYRRALLTRTLIIPFVIISLFLFIWMIFTKYSIQIL
ncbi:MAG: hypothetical protein ED557_13190 [Balneola sp.]|nr:MAG: hypothetical protein ED557_13190 [Balneola sp.]